LDALPCYQGQTKKAAAVIEQRSFCAHLLDCRTNSSGMMRTTRE
jgi:hypothetical protein